MAIRTFASLVSPVQIRVGHGQQRHGTLKHIHRVGVFRKLLEAIIHVIGDFSGCPYLFVEVIKLPASGRSPFKSKYAVSMKDERSASSSMR